MTTELDNERALVDRIFWLAVICLIEVGVLSGVAMATNSTAATVAVVVAPLINIVTAAGASLYTRRSRPSTDPTDLPLSGVIADHDRIENP